MVSRSMHAVWHPCTQMKQLEQSPPIAIASGEGVWLTDINGKRYLDAVSSWWVNLFGHQNPHIKQAIIQQLNQIEHVMLAGFTHEPVVTLSEQLTGLTGLGHSFYGSDGASAVEIALKMSFHYWRNCGQADKNRFLCLQNSYHGETIGALAVTDVAIFKDAYAPLLRAAQHLPAPDVRMASVGETPQEYALRCAQALEDYLAEHHTQIAALIVEPMIQCATGMAMYDALYLQRARQICTRYHVHLIADEIAVGFGRTGKMFACEHANIQPDMICLSKGITGGFLPLSVVQTTDAIYQAFYDDQTTRGFLHSHSYTGNPLACSAALATLDIFAKQDVLGQNAQTAAHISALLQQQLAHLPITHLRHLGMIWAFDVATQAPQFSHRCHQTALQHGLLIRPIGNTVYLMPPYCISVEESNWMVEQLRKSLEACL